MKYINSTDSLSLKKIESDILSDSIFYTAPDDIDLFLQSPLWALFKTMHGWQKIFFTFSWNQNSHFLSVLIRKISYLGYFVYIPHGPHVCITTQKERNEFLSKLSTSLEKFLPKNTVCIRFDPPWEIIQLSKSNNWLKPLCKPITNIQPPDTVILNISQDEQTLLEKMKPKWRYNIKLAQKKGVTIRYLSGEQAATKGITIFYSLYRETSKRDGISIHSQSYYANLVRQFSSVRVYIAEHEGEPLASIITIFYKNCATYVYGASSNEKRNLMPAYLLQWTAITDAKKEGCTFYDFYGIPPKEDPSHPMYGLYRFKTGFGGEIIHRIGSIDYVIQKFPYFLYQSAELIRSIWYKKIKKINFLESIKKVTRFHFTDKNQSKS